jgi:hypothetical protein
MKRIVIISAVLLTSFFGYSQSFEVLNTDTAFYGSRQDSDFGGNIGLVNNTAGTVALKWIRTENDLPAGWVTSICDPTSCKPPESDSSNFNLPMTGASNYINIHFYPDGIEGIGTTKIRVEDPSDMSNYYVLSFVGDARSITGINEFSSSTISMFPNPSNGNLNINSSSTDLISVSVFNMIGEEVLQFSGNIKIQQDISDLNTGIYLIQVGNGINKFTEKLVVR